MASERHWCSDDGLAELWRADARQLDMLEDESVDLVVTSPPYWAMRSYRDGGEHYEGQIGSEGTPAEFVSALIDCTREWVRVLKPAGSLFINLGDKYVKKGLQGLPWRYANTAVDELDLILRAEIVNSKPNGIPEAVRDRVRRSHETWFHFTSELTYFAAIDEIREPHKHPIPEPTTSSRKTKGEGGDHVTSSAAMKTGGINDSLIKSGQVWTNPLGRSPGSVWSIPSEPLRIPDDARERYDLPDHFAAFPQEWPRRIVLGWTPNGICVECEQGRRPDVDREYIRTQNDGEHTRTMRNPDNNFGSANMPFGKAFRTTTITGYTCGCPNTDAPTTPATVLDPFAGTGTTVGVARALGRRGIGIDLSADYLRLAQWRVDHSGHFEKTKPNPIRQ